MNGISVMETTLKVRQSLVEAIEALKSLHVALLDFHAITQNEKILTNANQAHFQLGYLTGMLSKLDEEIAKGVQ